MSYKYYMYGLNIESDLCIEEAFPSAFTTEPDVKVIIGDMPEELLESIKDIPEDQYYLKRSNNAASFRIPGVCDYLITRDVITIHPLTDVNSHDIKTFLLGSSFGLCAVLRQHVMLHGGATAIADKGVIITGESGAGKSTISNRLLEQGGQFIADDVCAVTLEGDTAHINMAYPQQKLCRDAAVARGYELKDLIYINEDRDKFAVRLKDNYLVDGASFNFLFELALTDNDTTTVTKIDGGEKYKLLLRNIYRGTEAFNMWGVHPMYMKKCLDITTKITAYRIERPRSKSTVDEIVNIINSIISNS